MRNLIIALTALFTLSFGVKAQNEINPDSWIGVLPELSAEDVQELEDMSPQVNLFVKGLKQSTPIPLNDMSVLTLVSDGSDSLELSFMFIGPMAFFSIPAEDLLNDTLSDDRLSRFETVQRIIFVIGNQNEEEEFLIPLILQRLAVGKSVVLSVYGYLEDRTPQHIIATLQPSGMIDPILFLEESMPDLWDEDASDEVAEENLAVEQVMIVPPDMVETTVMSIDDLRNEKIAEPVRIRPEQPGAATPAIDDDRVVKVVEEQPEFPGGMSKMMQWLSENIEYPQKAQDNYVQGRVIVQFIVEKDGSISSPSIVKGVDKDLDAEALRVVEMMPDWEPGKNNRQPVRCYFTLPINFKLNAAEPDESSR